MLYEFLKNFLWLSLVPQRNFYSILSISSYGNPNCIYFISNEMMELFVLWILLSTVNLKGEPFLGRGLGFLGVIFGFFSMSKLLLQFEAKSLNPVMTPLTGVTFALVRDSLSLSLPLYLSFNTESWVTSVNSQCNEGFAILYRYSVTQEIHLLRYLLLVPNSIPTKYW